jgi:hypothetical protein
MDGAVGCRKKDRDRASSDANPGLPLRGRLLISDVGLKSHELLQQVWQERLLTR